MNTDDKKEAPTSAGNPEKKDASKTNENTVVGDKKTDATHQNPSQDKKV